MPVSAYQFGPFVLRCREHILTRNGTRVPLSPKAFDVLHLLVQHSGSLLEKRELLATLWPETFVEEANLSVQVAAIRKALQPELADAIETVPKRGYRFTAPVAHETATRQPAGASRDVVRLWVMPWRVLAPNLDAEFLSRSLPDAIAAELAASPWLSVRAPLDLHDVARATSSPAPAESDVVLEGSLGALAGQSCVRLRLLDARDGTVLYADQTAVSLDHLHDLQARVSRQLTERLASHFGRAEPRVRETASPAPPGAYVLYLRANQLAYETSQWESARDLYEAVVREAPDFAPAWARLGRCHRVIAKFAHADASRESFSRAESALTRALSIDPGLSIAHSLYAQLDVDLGRPERAMQRLVTRIASQPHAPDLFAGLVHVLRFCGLLDLSIAAHRRARLLDPTVPTSVHHTWWMKGEYEQALAETFGDIGYLPGLALASLGRHRDAIAALQWRERDVTDTRVRGYLVSLRALLEGQREESLTTLRQLRGPVDAEARYYVARTYAALGEADLAISDLAEAVEGGFLCHDPFAQDPWLTPLHADPRFVRLTMEARERSAKAAAVFAEAGGHRILGT